MRESKGMEEEGGRGRKEEVGRKGGDEKEAGDGGGEMKSCGKSSRSAWRMSRIVIRCYSGEKDMREEVGRGSEGPPNRK